MKIKVQEATNTQLDWLVAKCEQAAGKNIREGFGGSLLVVGDHDFGAPSRYSTDWAQAGPIIEREGVSTIKLEHEYGVDSKGFTTNKRIPVFGAIIGEYFDTDQQRNSYGENYGEIYCISTELVTTGPTPLIAAMRCYVASKLGDEVEMISDLA